jgi:aldehyde:ferredoxin oxidoreductase
MGKVLHVDLRSGEFETKKLDLDVARDYVGGLGLNARLMEQVYVTGTDPLSPDNPIILGAGPLVGTGTPGAAKIVATTRFPLNGTISESVGSMRFALNLKGAGFDHLIMTGRAKKPVVLVLEDDKASFMDAKELWGMDIFQTTDALKKSHAGRRSSVIAIGPAGENRVAFSLALVDKASTVGRGGLGAVMGSKNLKAIVAMGDQRPSSRTILGCWNWASWRTGTIMFINSLAAGILRAHFRLKRPLNSMALKFTEALR